MISYAQALQMWWHSRMSFSDDLVLKYYAVGNKDLETYCRKFSNCFRRFSRLGFSEESLIVLSQVADETERELRSLSVEWNKNMKGKVFEFIEEVYKEEEEWCDASRITYLSEQIQYWQNEINKVETRFESQREDGTPTQKRLELYFIAQPQVMRDRLKKLENEYRFIRDKKEYEANKITQTDIAKAKEYPIEDIVTVDGKGFALCLNHSDSRPSMFCKDNFAHCFTCHWTADVIDVYRKVRNCGFIDAVKFLSGKRN